ncbi:MAG TPA: acetyltransferase [Dehalococcoidia bacterium]|jgi:sugar O-acyltransferase (sialic acid O-acetyltransferase NeuD family)|nr:acetyltransferase [Dehalococcoidia bacterium]
MAQKIVLAGNAITAQILHSYLVSDPRYRLVGVTVDDEFVSKGSVGDLPAVPISALASSFPASECRVVMAVGYSNLNRVRESLFDRLKAMGYAIETYVHPAASVHSQVPLGEGSVLLPGAVIEPLVTVGANVAVWANATLAHHCSVQEHCWIASGTVVSGQAKVGRNTFVGVNATIVNGVSVGEYSIVGAAALVSRNAPPHSVYLARSAERLRYSSDEYAKHVGF